MNASLEKAVIDMLLDKSDATCAVIREQLSYATVTKRELTDVGFFTNFAVAVDAPVKRDLPNMTLGNVGAELLGLKHGAGFLLFIRNGAITMLEGYTYDEKWPEAVDGFKLFRMDDKGRGFLHLQDTDVERDEQDRL
jgi:hypothetical protein